MTQSVPSTTARRLAILVVVGALFWHLLAIVSPPRQPPPPDTAGRDYASYHYALKVARAGGDPYDVAQLDAAAQADGTRSRVHPFFYPPPYLLLMVPTGPASLETGFGLWFILNELCLLAAAIALARGWRSFGPAIVPSIALIGATMYAVAYGSELGQANMPVLALILVGLWIEERRPVQAGIFIGLAAMLKMSPALLVAWWMLRRRWRAVGAAIATAIGLSILALPVVGFSEQWRFYTEILPGFGSGNYNGLVIKIGMFGNHSVPNVLHQLFPSGDAHSLSRIARSAGALITIGMLAGLGATFEGKTRDPVQIAAQSAAVLVAMLFVPVYTYEHHLVFAVPAMVLGIAAIERRWLGPRWIVPMGVSVAVLVYPLPYLRALARDVVTTFNAPGFFVVQEAKFFALCVVFAAMVRIGSTRHDPEKMSVPPPEPV